VHRNVSVATEPAVCGAVSRIPDRTTVARTTALRRRLFCGHADGRALAPRTRTRPRLGSGRDTPRCRDGTRPRSMGWADDGGFDDGDARRAAANAADRQNEAPDAGRTHDRSTG